LLCLIGAGKALLYQESYLETIASQETIFKVYVDHCCSKNKQILKSILTKQTFFLCCKINSH